MIVSVKEEKNEVLVTLCDDELLGKELNFNGVKIKINEKFYGGEKKDKKEIKSILKKATIINAIGKESVNFCLDEGYIDKERIIYINGIPHAEMFLLPRNL